MFNTSRSALLLGGASNRAAPRGAFSLAEGAPEKSHGGEGVGGADERIRTADLRITNALLYQLSYVGIARCG